MQTCLESLKLDLHDCWSRDIEIALYLVMTLALINFFVVIVQFLFFFLHSAMVRRTSSRIPFHCMYHFINELPEDVSDIHVNDVVLVPLLLNLNVSYTFLCCWLWAVKCLLGILLFLIYFVDGFSKLGTMFSINNWVTCIKIFTQCVSVHKQPRRSQRRIQNPVECLT